MAVGVLFASLDPALNLELETYNKDSGGVHPSNEFNPKPQTVVSGKVRNPQLAFRINRPTLSTSRTPSITAQAVRL
jgi:hypothetical protein